MHRTPRFCRKNIKKVAKTYRSNMSKIIFDYPVYGEYGKLLCMLKLINHTFYHAKKLLARLNTRLSTINISMKHLL